MRQRRMIDMYVIFCIMWKEREKFRECWRIRESRRREKLIGKACQSEVYQITENVLHQIILRDFFLLFLSVIFPFSFKGFCHMFMCSQNCMHFALACTEREMLPFFLFFFLNSFEVCFCTRNWTEYFFKKNVKTV